MVLRAKDAVFFIIREAGIHYSLAETTQTFIYALRNMNGADETDSCVARADQIIGCCICAAEIV